MHQTWFLNVMKWQFSTPVGENVQKLFRSIVLWLHSRVANSGEDVSGRGQDGIPNA